jgi:hypothetical protein
MPRYYLNVRQGQILHRDPEGAEFADLEQAREEAVHCARELVAAAITENEPVRGHMEVADGDGLILATVRLRDIITIES